MRTVEVEQMWVCPKTFVLLVCPSFLDPPQRPPPRNPSEARVDSAPVNFSAAVVVISRRLGWERTRKWKGKKEKENSRNEEETNKI
jgi:hypothetical protein